MRTKHILEHGDYLKRIMENLNDTDQARLDKLLEKSLRIKDVHEMIELLNSGANPNAVIGVYSEYSYPISYAVAFGTTEQVKALIEHGANVNVNVNVDARHEKKPFTVLQEAVYRSRSRIVRLLINAGANVNVESKKRGENLIFISVLGFTADVDKKNTIKELIDFGLDVNQTIKDLDLMESTWTGVNPETPLQVAVSKMLPKTVEQLIEMGADPDIKNKEGENCLDMILKMQYDRFRRTLKRNSSWSSEQEKWFSLTKKEICKSLVNAGVDVSSESLNKIKEIFGTDLSWIDFEKHKEKNRSKAAQLAALKMGF